MEREQISSKRKQPKKKNITGHSSIGKANSSQSIEYCQGCLETEEEDMQSGAEQMWVQCDQCDGLLHADCISGPVDIDEPFICPDCV
ncbi:hypothetical protein DPMN_160744 [Dreissena polymorpha]|uniref:PHD-type domain-containing protein n=1 Tax=Dreissena polymorpha TaxID=45954 RepID=A0A9D4IRX6_DREPO|nr:hypothetical protein DPMN_160744 [Dreissena polymorpha]